MKININNWYFCVKDRPFFSGGVGGGGGGDEKFSSAINFVLN